MRVVLGVRHEDARVLFRSLVVDDAPFLGRAGQAVAFECEGTCLRYEVRSDDLWKAVALIEDLLRCLRPVMEILGCRRWEE